MEFMRVAEAIQTLAALGFTTDSLMEGLSVKVGASIPPVFVPYLDTLAQYVDAGTVRKLAA